MSKKPNESQVRAARELLRWTQLQLAEAAEINIATVRRFEREDKKISDKTSDAIIAALQRAHVVFLNDVDHDGFKVRGVAIKPEAKPLPLPARRELTIPRAPGSRTGAKFRKPRDQTKP